MELLKKYKFFGGRIVKTGIAVFLTALICDLLSWPPMFAVITAIVTIEPTAAHSIKKAFVRFPASAIGAAFSVLFNFVFGDSPFTYMLVAVTTIIVCYKLRLHDGTLVAVLTGVAMISTVHDHFLSSFFIRLGTTGIGLTVSALVNFLVIKPNYSLMIKSKLHHYIIETGTVIEERGKEIVFQQPLHQETKAKFERLWKDFESVETLCEYQKQEWKLHHIDRKYTREFHYEYKKLSTMRQMFFHVANLMAIPPLDAPLCKEESIQLMFKSFKYALNDKEYRMDEGHLQVAAELRSIFKKCVQEDKCPQTYIALLFELLSIHDLIEELHQIQLLAHKHQKFIQYKGANAEM
ncbi:aromatic acid exporter family protein [Robertmurraya korlensis]|uniref:aromatic acid exporter family protein n=1 Tax=Robertmurraya korlensis TaxID=519977 RepID=UPI000824D450|nr:aromatic acid exporter family protein [Robertmurraya korlensis]